jgi:hypothetical protein
MAMTRKNSNRHFALETSEPNLLLTAELAGDQGAPFFGMIFDHLYVLQHATRDGLSGPGALIRIGPDGTYPPGQQGSYQAYGSRDRAP